MTRSLLALFLTGAALVPAFAQAQDSQPAVSTGFFHARQIDRHWELVDPQGRPFFSVGVAAVDFHQDAILRTPRHPYQEAAQAKYGSEEAWREATAGRLVDLGFNTLGAWSDDKIAKVEVRNRRMVYTHILNLGSHYIRSKVQAEQGAHAWMKGLFPDVFDSDFANYVKVQAEAVCGPLKDDPNLLGWFSDNELRWGPDWRGKDELLVEFLNLPAGTPGRDAALELLKQRYLEVAKFNRVWGTAFASWEEAGHAPKFATPPGAVQEHVFTQNGEVNRTGSNAEGRAFIADCDAFLELLANRYFEITTRAIRAVDPNHMVMGCRFAFVPPSMVVAAAGKYCDVISINCYSWDPTWSLRGYAAANKPLLIGEFGFRAKDSGLPNLKGAGPIVETEADRARCYETYVKAALRNPSVVGCHWFKWADEPKEGRFDGENSNYGIVTIDDRPYELVCRTMKEVNALAAMDWNARQKALSVSPKPTR